MPLERIIITFTETGDFRGASATDFAGLPVHLDPTELGKKVNKLNAAALARLVDIDAELATKEAAIAAAKLEADEVKASITIIETAIDDPTIDDAGTLAIAKAEAQKSKLTKKQKEKAAIRAQIAELQEQLKD